MSRSVVVLGATGTVGRNTLDVAARHPDRCRIVGLSANRDDAALFELCVAHRVPHAAMADPAAAQRLRERAREDGLSVTVHSGPQGLEDLAALDGADTVMAAIVGAAGLLPTLAAVRAGRRVLLASKEALVMTGELFMREVRSNGCELIPIDSEHNAIFQCLPAGSESGRRPAGVRKLILTASGGPFLDRPEHELATVTPAQAVAHPNWAMGRKISVDSATMMNKGLEFIEASRLFDLGGEAIEVVIHPQSAVHSLVGYEDGSFLAQLGAADMRIPIAHALASPERWASGAQMLDLVALSRLDFSAPDENRFPSLRLAREALASGGPAPAAMNAANEVAVSAFLDEQLTFPQITATVDHVLGALGGTAPDDVSTVDAVLEVDAWARSTARQFMGCGHA